jgi:hypothetical protein
MTLFWLGFPTRCIKVPAALAADLNKGKKAHLPEVFGD